ncbi:MAG: hypothetical protein II816_02260, partial [Elusimicrobia bacterium]|nr:hypothetical protein [Elusimicrobiota bacterium]
RKILEENRDKLEYLVQMLMERETLTGDQIDIIMKGEKLEPREIDKEKTEPVEPLKQPELTEQKIEEKKKVVEEPKVEEKKPVQEDLFK